MAQFLAPLINNQQEDSNGAPLSGGSIEVYLAGTSTPATTTSDKAGAVPNTWPIVLNTLGVNQQGAVWITGGFLYKYVIKNSVGIVQRTIDNLSGINDTAVAIDQWIPYQGTPTYVSATSFTVVGDQTAIFQVGRRLKSMNTGGTIYSTITTSTYSAPNTTVTVRNDSGALDAGLSQVSYGVVSIDQSSISGIYIGTRTLSGTGVFNATPGTTKIRLRGVGGGGAGGGAAANSATTICSGSGGAAGSFAEAVLTSGFNGVPYSVGAGGVPVSGTAGGPGGATTFGTAGALLNCPGGGGGQTTQTSTATTAAIVGQGVPGGAPTGTGIVFGSVGQPGPSGINFGTANLPVSGQGAPSPFGAGGQNTSSGAGSGPSGGYGGGGGGAATLVSAGAAVPGGAGTPGILLIDEYT